MALSDLLSASLPLPTPLSEADLVQALKVTRDNIIFALATDSLSPKLNYNIDGQAVDRTSWRKSMTDWLHEVQELILAYEPYEGQSVML